jgi:lysophospholipase L1-like esterase
MKNLKVMILAGLFLVTALSHAKGAEKLDDPNLTAGPTIWLIGDSTVASYPKERDPTAGWGQLLHEYCKKGVTIENHAVSGTTSHSFRSRKFWEKVIPNVKKGDYMFIQFGHNDHYKENGQHLVSTEDFKQNLIGYVKEVQEKGAFPILVTPMCRRIYSEGKISRSFGDYPNMVVEAAKETNTPLIDLHEITYEEFNKLNDDQIKAIFLFLPPNKYPAFPEGKQDGVHFQTNGARKLAGWVVRDAKKQRLKIAELFEKAATEDPEVHVKTEDCKGDLKEHGPGLNREKLVP